MRWHMYMLCVTMREGNHAYGAGTFMRHIAREMALGALRRVV